MKDWDLVERLKATGRGFYTVADMEKITGLDRPSLYVSLSRLSRRGVLRRAARNLYVLPDAFPRWRVWPPICTSLATSLSRASSPGRV